MKKDTAQSILNDALYLLETRGEHYDNCQERSMGKIVEMFNIATGHSLTETEGWQFMQILKLVRATTSNEVHVDSFRDGVAYAALAAESAFTTKPEKQCLTTKSTCANQSVPMSGLLKQSGSTTTRCSCSTRPSA